MLIKRIIKNTETKKNKKNIKEMKRQIDISKKLKKVPIGTKLYCTIHGEVEFMGFKTDMDEYHIKFKDINGVETFLTNEGKYFSHLNGECILFPSKSNRNWDKYSYDSIKIGTPVMVSDTSDPHWILQYYAGNHRCYAQGNKKDIFLWDEIIPVTEFDFKKQCKKRKTRKVKVK